MKVASKVRFETEKLNASLAYYYTKEHNQAIIDFAADTCAVINNVLCNNRRLPEPGRGLRDVRRSVPRTTVAIRVHV